MLLAKKKKKKGHTENWNRIDTPETDSHKYSQGDRIVFSINGAGIIAHLYAKKSRYSPYIFHITYLKKIIDLNVKLNL